MSKPYVVRWGFHFEHLAEFDTFAEAAAKFHALDGDAHIVNGDGGDGTNFSGLTDEEREELL